MENLARKIDTTYYDVAYVVGLRGEFVYTYPFVCFFFMYVYALWPYSEIPLVVARYAIFFNLGSQGHDSHLEIVQP